MHASLGRQQAVGVLSGDGQRRALEARFVTRLVVDQLAREPAALGPAQIHPQQHLRPVLGLGPSGARMDGHDRILAIVLAAEHFLDLAGLHFLIERLERLTELRVHGFAGFGPFDEHGEVVALLPEGFDEGAILIESPAALKHFLRLGLVFPEIGRRGARLEARQFVKGSGGLKDSSADRLPVC